MDTESVSWFQHGKNVEIAKDDEYLYVRVAVDEEKKAQSEPSKSGKTRVLGTTGGFVKYQGISVSLNAVIPNGE